MPKLLFMVACEQIIFDREDNTASLINIVEGVGIVTKEELPQEAELPQRWGVYAMWRREDAEVGQGFVQRLEIVSPKGRVAKENELPFKFSDGKFNHRVKLNIIGLPIGEAGVWSINLSVKEDAPDAQWSHAGWLPFHVEHNRPQNEESTVEAAEAE